MKQRRFFNESFAKRFGDAALRFTGVAIATLLLVLCSPFINPKQKDDEPKPAASVAPEQPERVGVKLRRGDTLASVVMRFGLKPPSAHAMIEKVRPFLNPSKVQAGHDVNVVLSPEDKTVQGVEFVVEDSLFRVKATDDGWLAEREAIPFVRETRVIRGTVKDSLYQSGIDAGLSPQQILNLAKLFEYDIDFFSDFQRSDAFSVVLDEVRYADGRRGMGKIIAAELEVDDENFSAFYYVANDGSGSYYDSDGRALRRSLRRAPLSYARISSPFNTARLHPIYRTVRPHQAIDYAAPAGTPVVAIGRGRVEFVGWRNGYGNVVDIRHAGNYMSRYAHFSRFAANLGRGEAVDSCVVIGCVGETGHATGPHLHFEFLRGDTKINFLDLRIPKNQQLSGEDLLRFDRLREQQLALLRNNGDRVADSANKGL